jgi:hypothetical protein
MLPTECLIPLTRGTSVKMMFNSFACKRPVVCNDYREQNLDQLREGEADFFIASLDIEGKGHIDIHK